LEHAGERRKMQYLVTMDYVDPGPMLPPEGLIGILRSAVLPSEETLVKMESEGKILAGGFPVGERAVAFVIEAESNKELDDLLEDLPFWGLVRTKVTPLQRFEDRHEHDRQFLERLESTLQR
jgi:muconolactone delta-isomerase